MWPAGYSTAGHTSNAVTAPTTAGAQPVAAADRFTGTVLAELGVAGDGHVGEMSRGDLTCPGVRVGHIRLGEAV
jgi:hypothetical protein